MDIVERLRAFRPPYGWPEEYSIIQEAPLNEAAIDEITRLRKQVDEMHDECVSGMNEITILRAENAALRALVSPYRSKTDET